MTMTATTTAATSALTRDQDYDRTLARARRAVRRMIAAELEVGRLVHEIGIDRVDQTARDLGVRRSVLIGAALQSRGLVRRHRSLEREIGDRARRAVK